jgi:alpha-galactosidase
MIKVTIIGAGSSFTRYLATDIICTPGLDQGTLALVDIDARRLNLAHQLVERIIQLTGKDWKVESSINRRDVLKNSDFLINQIEVAGLDTVKKEFEIPLKYGVNQCIGDTMGPGGLFKTLRTLPSWLEIVKDIEELSPNAYILNYTNPMSAITLGTTRVTDMPVIGLCHSVQNTTKLLAKFLEVPYEELRWKCGGINHMAWITELTHKGQDMYPILFKKAEDPKFLAKDPVRLDAMKYLGVFVTESSGHFSEYIPYYRKRDDLIEKYCALGYNGETGFYANNWPKWREDTDNHVYNIATGAEPIKLEPGHEYAAIIINGIVNNDPKIIYGNIPNGGLIENLPSNGIVEVACLIDGTGIHPTKFGPLPEHLAALNRSNMAFFELAVSAVLNKDRDMAMRALLIDPLTAAVCSPSEIKAMFDEMYEAEKDYIPVLK